MASRSFNLEAAGESSPRRVRVRKKVRIRVKLDDGKKKKKRNQMLLLIFVLFLIVAGVVAAFNLYKMDQNSAPPQIEVMPPTAG